MPRMTDSISARTAHAIIVLVVALLPALLTSPAWAQDGSDVPAEDDETTETLTGASDDDLRLGAQVYSETCSSCHQPGGLGIARQFPPLVANPNVEDTAYLVEVIEAGLEGVIEVLGETYDGRMPAFSTLSAEEIDALVAYIQNGFVVPAAPSAGPADTSDDGGLPGLTSTGALLAYAVVAVVISVVFRRRIAGANDRLEMPWLDAYLKSGVIVVVFVVFVVFVPSWAMQTDRVAKMDDLAQELIGTGLWLAGLGGGLIGLWYAHREDRV